MATEVTHIIDPDGGAGYDYLSLNSWEAAQNRDITLETGDDTIAIALCVSSAGSADTTNVSIDGWTASAGNYIKVFEDWTCPVSGNFYDTTKYRLELTGNLAFAAYRTTKFHNIQFKFTPTANSQEVYRVNNFSSSGSIEFINCLFKGVMGSYIDVRGSVFGHSVNSYFINCVLWDWPGAYNRPILGVNNVADTIYIYNNTFHNCEKAAQAQNGITIIATNNIFHDCVTDITLDGSGGTIILLTNDSDDGDYFVDEANDNFHLVVGSAPVDAGTDLSGIFTTDIDGDTRTGTWDIGADEYVAAGGATIVSSIDSVLKQNKQVNVSIDSILKSIIIVYNSFDFVLLEQKNKQFSIDSILKKLGIESSFSIDSILQNFFLEDLSIDAILKIVNDKNISIDAILKKLGIEYIVSLDAILHGSNSIISNLDSVLNDKYSVIVSLDSILKQLNSNETNLDTILRIANDKNISLDLILKKLGIESTTSLDAILISAIVKEISISLDSILKQLNLTDETNLDSVLKVLGIESTVSVDSILEQNISKLTDLDAILKIVNQKYIFIDAILKQLIISNTTLDGILQELNVSSISNLDAILIAELANIKNISLDLILKKLGIYFTASLDSILLLQDIKIISLDSVLQENLDILTIVDAVLIKSIIKSLSIDSVLKKINNNILISLDANLVKGYDEINFLDSLLVKTFTKVINLDGILQGELTKITSLDAILYLVTAGLINFTAKSRNYNFIAKSRNYNFIAKSRNYNFIAKSRN